jgi:putative FmdB family regulatory protein
MPIYEYECQRCGVFEARQKITEPPLERHDCGEPVERKMSVTAFALKGGGWYADGYASKSACSPSGCDKPACEAKA